MANEEIKAEYRLMLISYLHKKYDMGIDELQKKDLPNLERIYFKRGNKQVNMGFENRCYHCNTPFIMKNGWEATCPICRKKLSLEVD